MYPAVLLVHKTLYKKNNKKIKKNQWVVLRTLHAHEMNGRHGYTELQILGDSNKVCISTSSAFSRTVGPTLKPEERLAFCKKLQAHSTFRCVVMGANARRCLQTQNEIVASKRELPVKHPYLYVTPCYYYHYQG